MPDPLTRAELNVIKARNENWRPGRNGELHPVAKDMARMIESYEKAMKALGYCSSRSYGACLSLRCPGCDELLKGWQE